MPQISRFFFFSGPHKSPSTSAEAIEAVSEVNDLEFLWSSLKDQPGGWLEDFPWDFNGDSMGFSVGFNGIY